MSIAGLEWERQPGPQDCHILSAPIHVNGSERVVRKWLRRIRRANTGGWYVQRYRGAGSAWGAMEPRITYDTIQYAKGAAVGSLRAEELTA